MKIGEDAGEGLARKLWELQEEVTVRILYFSPDKRKRNVACLVQEGMGKRIDLIAGTIILSGGSLMLRLSQAAERGQRKTDPERKNRPLPTA